MKTKEALEKLSRQPVPDRLTQRLAPLFASHVAKRKEQERKNEFEYHNPPVFVEHLRSQAAKLIEKEAEKTAATFPIISVFDALQIAKSHKKAKTDAGLRNLIGMLDTAWKKDRTANILAGTFVKYKDYYCSSFPRSAVVEVFDKMGSTGYATLDVRRLMAIASRIQSQDDFDYEMNQAGYISKNPYDVKARNFVLALVNNDAEWLGWDDMAVYRDPNMKQFVNTDPGFGDVGPFEAESKEALVDQMESIFKQWAREESEGDPALFQDRLEGIRSDFLNALKEYDSIEGIQARTKHSMPEAMSTEASNNAAYDLIAMVSGASYYALDTFPGMDALGLSVDDPHDMDIGTAVGLAIRAASAWSDTGDNSSPFGELSAMLRFGVVAEDEVKDAIIHAYTETLDSGAMHDAF
jgi:hypothetical protein